ncbi:MAG: ATP-binding cassette domain-containing protein [Gemmatimonadota bacterium]|nr:ATP-binding cassette domain-containing protein [Gemmatimonadota bacterium]
MLGARDLRQRYAGRTVVDVPSLDLEPGTVTALVGPNGSGKSTLLRLLAFVESPAEGTVLLRGRPVQTAAARRAARRDVTLVEQHPLLFAMTVAENLRYALTARRQRDPDAAGRILQALDRVGVADLANRAARQLSAGELQRVALARALLLRPRALLLDEPASAADRGARSALAEVLTALHKEEVTVCLASHQLEDAYRWSSRVLALADGRLAPVTPENLFRVTLPPGGGPRVVRAGPLEFLVVTETSGPATLAISPDDIIVSTAALQSSARNQFAGGVVAVSDDGHGHVRLVVDVGTPLVVRITPAALAELGISLGTRVHLSVKAMAVRVI